MPELDSKLKTRYPAGRVKAFSPGGKETIEIINRKSMPPNKFQHLLRYDAESTFWLLLWWCIQARPAEGVSSYITDIDWTNLIAETDR
jgi:hypothetical protein